MTRVSTIDTLKFNGLRRTRLGPSCCQIKPKTRLSAVNVGWVWPLINAFASGLMVIPTDLRLKGFKVRWFTVRLRPTVDCCSWRTRLYLRCCCFTILEHSFIALHLFDSRGYSMRNIIPICLIILFVFFTETCPRTHMVQTAFALVKHT